MRGPNIQALYDEQIPGRCAICDVPFPDKKNTRGQKHRFICSNPECKEYYDSQYQADRWLKIREQRERQAPKEEP